MAMPLPSAAVNAGSLGLVSQRLAWAVELRPSSLKMLTYSFRAISPLDSAAAISAATSRSRQMRSPMPGTRSHVAGAVGPAGGLDAVQAGHPDAHQDLGCAAGPFS